MFDQDKKRNCVEVEYPVVGMAESKQDGDMWIMLYGEIQERLLL